jgi:hypothetical protein
LRGWGSSTEYLESEGKRGLRVRVTRSVSEGAEEIVGASGEEVWGKRFAERAQMGFATDKSWKRELLCVPVLCMHTSTGMCVRVC